MPGYKRTTDVRKYKSNGKQKIDTLMAPYLLQAKRILTKANSGDKNTFLEVREVLGCHTIPEKLTKLNLALAKEYVAKKNDAQDWNELLINVAVMSGCQNGLRQYRDLIDKKSDAQWPGTALL